MISDVLMKYIHMRHTQAPRETDDVVVRSNECELEILTHRSRVRHTLRIHVLRAPDGDFHGTHKEFG